MRNIFGMKKSQHGVFVGQSMTRDGMMTFDSIRARMGDSDHPGVKLPFPCKMADGKTVDSTGAFLVGELERLDLTLHMPLASVSWGRDIDLREDVSIADEISSFSLSTFGSSGGLGTGNGIGNGKAWIGRKTDQVTGISADIAKITNPLSPWAVELKYTILELESAAKIGRPIDDQLYQGLKLKHQMDVDEQVYYGDSSMAATGLTNSALVVPTNVVNGASGASQWSQKTADEILNDVNAALTAVWAASAWAVMPTRILIPPAQYGAISTAKIGLAANESILQYVLKNNLLATTAGAKLEIYPLKWLIGAGVGGTIGTVGIDRMMVYTKEKERVRYPMTMLQRTPVQYDSIFHKTTYFAKLGRVEVVYPETVGYFDGI